MSSTGQVDASSSALSTDAAIQHFVAAIATLPWVAEVVLEGAVPFARLTTVISAPPFDSSYRRPIYEAQAEALRMMARPGVEFRLVNKQELEDDLAQALPEAYHALYHRQDVAS